MTNMFLVEAGDGLRERTRRVVREELLHSAWGLFLERGYEATTMEEIASAAGLSRRSLFRYFDSKDDILVQCLSATGTKIADALGAVDPHVTPWRSLRLAFDTLIALMTAHEHAVIMTKLILDSPTVQAGHNRKVTNWRATIANALAPRLALTLTETDRSIQADALSGAALACLASAQTVWVASDGRLSLADLLDTAMNAVASTSTDRH